jgi:hypothetical protein
MTTRNLVQAIHLALAGNRRIATVTYGSCKRRWHRLADRMAQRSGSGHLECGAFPPLLFFALL